MYPQISVIVPVYKVEPYLRRCVDSILRQTFTDFELILVDDGSPDNCPAICDEYAQKDNRIHVIHQENGGLSAARNAGIDWAFANSDSQWLTFIDSDDWIHPEMIERLYQAVSDHNVNVSICSYIETNGEEPEQILSAASDVWNPEQYYVEHTVNATVAWGKLYRKSCFKTIRYPIGKIHEDEFITYKILFACDWIAFINTPMYYYYMNADGITKAAWSPRRMDVFEAYDQQLNFFADHKYEGVYKVRLKQCVFSYAAQISKLQKENSQSSYICMLRKSMRKRITEARRQHLLSIQINAWCYELAYPRWMSCYWYWKILCRKLHITKE